MINTPILSHESMLTAADNLYAPIVRLSPALLPARLRDRGISLLAVLGYCTPSLNIKFIPASYMLESALASGNYRYAAMLVENSSGNFALSLAYCARKHGLRVTAIVSDAVPASKLSLLQAGGVHVLKEREARTQFGVSGDAGGVEIAAQLAAQEDWINLGQYTSAINPAAYEHLLARAILQATGGKIGLFAAALGSTGTMIGLGGTFKRAIAGLETIAIIPHLGHDIPGCRDDRRLGEITLDWRACVDHRKYISAQDAYRASLQLWASAIPAGPSAGAAFAGLCEFLLDMELQGRLERYRREDGSLVAMLPFADTLHPYFEQAVKYCPEYFEHVLHLPENQQPALVPAA